MNLTQIALWVYCVSVAVGLCALFRNYMVSGQFDVKDVVSFLLCIAPIINTVFSFVLLVTMLQDLVTYIEDNGNKVLFSRKKK